MTDEPWQEEPGAKVTIIKGGPPTMTVDVIGKMLWLEGFAWPREPGNDGKLHYAVVSKANIEAVLENLYQVDVPANIVIRWLRQAGLIQYADALTVVGGPMVFRYTCAKAVRDREPTTIDDVDRAIQIVAMAMDAATAALGPRPEDPRDVAREAQELEAAQLSADKDRVIAELMEETEA